MSRQMQWHQRIQRTWSVRYPSPMPTTYTHGARVFLIASLPRSPSRGDPRASSGSCFPPPSVMDQRGVRVSLAPSRHVFPSSSSFLLPVGLSTRYCSSRCSVRRSNAEGPSPTVTPAAEIACPRAPSIALCFAQLAGLPSRRQGFATQASPWHSLGRSVSPWQPGSHVPRPCAQGLFGPAWPWGRMATWETLESFLVTKSCVD